MPQLLRSVRSIRWRGSRRAGVPLATALVAVLVALAGCVSSSGPAGPAAPTGPTQNAQRTANGKDIVTQSDKTDLDRRADIHLDLAREYYKNRQYTTAIDEIKQALVSRPDRADAYMLRALAYWGLGDNATADESFRRALQLRPNDPDTMLNYGTFLCGVNRYGDADAQFSAVEQIPNYVGIARVVFQQGVCQAQAGDLATAEKTLAHAYELDASSAYTAYHLSLVLYRRGQFDRARFYIRRINMREDVVTAPSLWLAARIERKLGNDEGVQSFGRQLHERFPQASETQLFDKGRFDD